jgi:hypothetical protein
MYVPYSDFNYKTDEESGLVGASLPLSILQD